MLQELGLFLTFHVEGCCWEVGSPEMSVSRACLFGPESPSRLQSAQGWVLLCYLPVLLGKVFVGEREEKTAPNMSQRPRKYLVRGWVCARSQVSEWDQGPSLEALRRPFSAGVLTVRAVSQAAPHPVQNHAFRAPD